jgi:hypothetical protein
MPACHSFLAVTSGHLYAKKCLELQTGQQSLIVLGTLRIARIVAFTYHDIIVSLKKPTESPTLPKAILRQYLPA